MAQPASVIILHPYTIRDYHEVVDRLAEFLLAATNYSDYAEVVSEFRKLIEKVVIYPRDAQTFDIEVRGRLASITGDSVFPDQCTSGRRGHTDGSGGRT